MIRGGLVLFALVAAACGRTDPQVFVEPVTGMEFVRIPAGDGIPAAFFMGRFEVTQAQWRRVMGSNPSAFAQDGDTRPVENVNFLEIGEFLRSLQQASPGHDFRLPSEAEWEHACRAGSTSEYSTGDVLTPADANFNPRPDTVATHGTTPAGSFPANAWGLHDMHGNVWEWTTTETGALKVIRGGSWYFGADSAACGLRYTHPPGDRGFSLGFRLAASRFGL